MFFCEGKCKIEKDSPDGMVTRRCGLLREIVMNNALTGETKHLEMCVFDAIMNSLHRQEQGQVRIQAAVESDRNENANQMEMTRKVLVGSILSSELKRKELDIAKISNSNIIDCISTVKEE